MSRIRIRIRNPVYESKDLDPCQMSRIRNTVSVSNRFDCDRFFQGSTPSFVLKGRRQKQDGLYQLGDSFYDADGEFLYRIPGAGE